MPFMSQGGFAKCFELTDMATNMTYAGKVIAKAQLQKSEQKEKVRLACDILSMFLNLVF